MEQTLAVEDECSPELIAERGPHERRRRRRRRQQQQRHHRCLQRSRQHHYNQLLFCKILLNKCRGRGFQTRDRTATLGEADVQSFDKISYFKMTNFHICKENDRLGRSAYDNK